MGTTEWGVQGPVERARSEPWETVTKREKRLDENRWVGALDKRETEVGTPVRIQRTGSARGVSPVHESLESPA